DKTENREASVQFLKNLNNYLITLNEKEATAVYVGITDYHNNIYTPIFPLGTTKLSQMESHVVDLLKKKDFSELSSNQLNTLLTYSKEFKALITEIYKGSLLSNTEKTNVFMPFTNTSVMQTLNKISPSGNEYIENKKVAFTVYTPKLETSFSKPKLRSIYKNSVPEFGLSVGQQKIALMVQAINTYFYEDYDYKDCEELLEKYKNKPILTHFPKFRELANKDPCILDYVVSYQPNDTKSEWMEITEMMIAVPLYGALSVPLLSVTGTVVAEEITRKQIKDAAITAGAEIAIQTVFNYYFGNEDIINEEDSEKRWTLALKAIDEKEFIKAVSESLLNLSTRKMIIVNCLQEGISLENFNWENDNIAQAISEASISINLKGCGKNVLYYLFVEKVKDQALGYLFEKLKTLATKDPKLFVKAWRQLCDDLGPNFKQTFKNGYLKYKEDIFNATGISDLSKNITNYIEASFNVDNAFDDTLSALSEEMGYTGKASTKFVNTAKDAAIETQLKIEAKTANNFSDNVRRKITAQGANVSLGFNINGKNEKIYSTLLEKLDDSTYRIVFVNPPSGGSKTYLTQQREKGLKALNTNQIEFKAVATGQNAQNMGLSNGHKINITEVSLRTKNTKEGFDEDVLARRNIVNTAGDVVTYLKNKGFSVFEEIDDVVFFRDANNKVGKILDKTKPDNITWFT
ncbi:MAG: hypothetical protein ACK5MZ_04115, partial [Aestuariibaculum sp.]